ncbi:MAG: hypothetical protein Ct9H300mP27_01300 [Chloroflexota bacterium]|nr:MAG: hypothetical protein Ct9H300mP27_01300 [Chloroflexota bacterium]
MSQFVYVSLQDEDKIMVFGLDSTTGSLTLAIGSNCRWQPIGANY